MASFEITMSMLEEIWRCGRNPLYDFVPNFVLWAKTEGGCWWWIKEGARKCIKVKIVYYRGSLNRRKKEEFAVQEIPFSEYPATKSKIKKLSVKDYIDFKNLLIEEWLKFINQTDSIREKINKYYDIVTDPRF